MGAFREGGPNKWFQPNHGVSFLRNHMGSLVLTLIVLFFSGCAARVFAVRLTSPKTVGTTSGVMVRDGRLDQQIYVTGISMGSKANIYLLAPEPPIEVALRQFISNKLSMTAEFPMTIIIERLDLKNRVGFAKADELYCELESRIAVANSSNNSVVRTFSKNTENMSPRVAASARVILQQCLEQHATEIVRQLNTGQDG
jgi:hypothetical protein